MNPLIKNLSTDLPLEDAVGDYVSFAAAPCGMVAPARHTAAMSDHVHRRIPTPEERQRRDDQVSSHPMPPWMTNPKLLPPKPPRRTPHSTPMGEWAVRAYRESVKSTRSR